MSREQLIQAARKAEQEARRSATNDRSPDDPHAEEQKMEEEGEEPQQSGPSTASEWRSALREIFEQAGVAFENTTQRRVLADLEEQVIQRVEALRGQDEMQRDTLVRQLKKKYEYQKAELEKRLVTLRSASATEGKNNVVQLQQRQREALARLQAEQSVQSLGMQILREELGESEELSFQYARKVAEAARKAAEQKRIEQLLQHKVNMLDGGRMQAELEKQRRAQHVAESAARRLMHGRLMHGWGQWRSWYDERRTMRNAARRLIYAGLGQCLRTWADACAASRQARQLLAKAAMRLQRPQLAACVAHWRRSWEDEARVVSEGGLKSQIAALRAELEDARSLLSSTYGYVDEGRMLREQLQSTMFEAERRETAAKEGWMRAETREAEARQQWIDRLYRNAARRLANLQLAKGFGAWVEMSETHSEQRRRLAAAVGRLRRPRVTAMYMHWKGDWQDAVARSLREAEATRARERRQQEEADRRRREEEEARRRAEEAAERDGAKGSGDGGVLDGSVGGKDGVDGAAAGGGREASGLRGGPEAEAEAKRLREDLAASDAALRIAREESSFLASMVAKQQDELEALRRAAYAAEQAHASMLQSERSLQDELERVRKACEAQIVHCGKQLLATQEELAGSREEMRRAEAALEALKAQLRAAGQPLAQKERKVLVKSLHSQMERMTEAVASNHLQRIRELAQLVALRDREPARSLDSKPLRNVSPGPTLVAALMAGPESLPGHGTPAATGTGSARGVGRPSPGGVSKPADLFVTPTFPEADSFAKQMAKLDAAERQQLLQAAKRQAAVSHLGGSGGQQVAADGAMNASQATLARSKVSSWESPFQRRSKSTLTRPRSAASLPPGRITLDLLR